MTVIILQWNARSIIAKGQEVKKFITDLTTLPDFICVQETQLKPQVNFIIPGYKTVSKDKIVTNWVAYKEIKQTHKQNALHSALHYEEIHKVMCGIC